MSRESVIPKFPHDLLELSLVYYSIEAIFFYKKLCQNVTAIFSVLAGFVKRNASVLSSGFYEVILSDPDALDFLTNDQVERQLKSAMDNLLRSVLSEAGRTVEVLISMQLESVKYMLV